MAKKKTTPRNPRNTNPGQNTPGRYNVKAGAGISKGTANQVNQQQAIEAANQYQTNVGMNGNIGSDFGQQTTTVDPRTGQITTNIAATGANKAALEAQQGLHSQGIGAASNMLSGISGADGANALQNTQNALYKNLSGSFEDQQNQKHEQLLAQMTNSGNGPGTPLYDQEMRNFENTAQRQRDNWQQEAISQASAQLGQNITNTGALSNLGTGYQAPTSQSIQGAGTTAANAGAAQTATMNAQANQAQGAGSMASGQGSLMGGQAAILNANTNAINASRPQVQGTPNQS